MIASPRLPVTVLAVLLLACFLPCLAEGGEVKGFPGIPTYPGAEHPEGTGTDYQEYSDQMLEKEGWIWYAFGEKLSEEWDNDAPALSQKIMQYYKTQLDDRGWEYVGDCVGSHHWVKDGEGIAIDIPADYDIQYKHMSAEDARASCGELTDEKFAEAFPLCIDAAQSVYAKHDMSTMEDFEQKMAELMTAEGDMEAMEAFNNNLQEEVKNAVGNTLKPYGVTFERLAELFSNRQDVLRDWVESNQEKMEQNPLGFLALIGIFE